MDKIINSNQYQSSYKELSTPLYSQIPEAKYEIVEETVSIDYNGQNIIGTLTYTNGEDNLPTILMLHGFKGNRNELDIAGSNETFYGRTARVLSEQGYATLRIDFIGSGESDGKWEDTTISNQIANAETALEYIRNLEFVDKNRVGILGLSQGGMVTACTIARNPDIKTAILWSPVDTPESVYSNLMGKEILQKAVETDDPSELLTATSERGEEITLRASFFKDFYTIDPIAEIRSYKGSLQVVVGSKDSVVSPQPFAGRKYIKYHTGNDGSKEELIVLTEGDHMFNVFEENSKELDIAIVSGLNFLNNTL